MAQRTCEVDGCERKHSARGMCSSHYGSWWKRTHPDAEAESRERQKVARTCVECGTEWRTTWKNAKYCSLQCKGDAYRIRTVCPLPRRHPVMQLLRPPRQASVTREADCEWCGSPFTTTKAAQRMCSEACKIKAKRCRRRGRQAGSTSHYTWSEVMRLFLAMGKRCAYCDQPVDGQPDPDHVVPLSKGGSNSITNIVPCCRPCNSDKRDLTLDAWAADRARRGLPDVRIDVERFTHLTISPAA